MEAREFTLPHGIRRDGQLLRRGRMTPLTLEAQMAIDGDARTRRNPAWRIPLSFQHTVTDLEDLKAPVPWEIWRELPFADAFYLMALFRELSGIEARMALVCSTCGRTTQVSALELASPTFTQPVQDQVSFELSQGLEVGGQLRRRGAVRGLRLGDVVEIDDDPRVQQNPGFRTVILLQRCILELDGAPIPLGPELLRGMWWGDARAVFQAILDASGGQDASAVKCSNCGAVLVSPWADVLSPFFWGLTAR